MTTEEKPQGLQKGAGVFVEQSGIKQSGSSLVQTR